VRELMRNVIKPATEEVNDCAEFIVNVENIKIGRKIIGFELSVENKNKTFPLDKQQLFKKNKVGQSIKLVFGGISESVLNNILESYSEDYILEKIAYTKKHAKKELTGLYPIPYFISALRNDYKSIEQRENNIEQLPGIPNQDYSWQEKLCYLEDDLNLWKRHLEHAKAIKNSLLMENAEKIIFQCEEKLQEHFLKRSKSSLEEETA